METAVEDFAVLYDFWKAGEAGEEEVKEAYDKSLERIEEAEFKSTLNQPEDELPAVVQINSGAGGTEKSVSHSHGRATGYCQSWSRP